MINGTGQNKCLTQMERQGGRGEVNRSLLGDGQMGWTDRLELLE